MPPSDTFFTAAPEWAWLVVLYFFLGGLAGGSYFLGAILGAFGSPADRPVARMAVYIAFIGVLLCGLLLIVDLTRPERFWHMLVQSETLWPMFKLWSPISVGAWALLIFGAFTFVSLIGALRESGRLRWNPPQVCCTEFFRHAFTILGTLAGFFLASYTGVLLSVTNRPIWADSNLVGLLFLVSAASTSAALLILLGVGRLAETRQSLRWLRRLDRWVMWIELALIVLFVASLGAVAQVWLSAWGALLLVGVVLVGILIPLTLHYRPRLLGRLSLPTAAVLVLIGGFLLRVVIVFSSEAL